MELPPNGGDLEQAKFRLAMRFRDFETRLMEELGEVANSGFADARLCAMARSDLEKAFLEIEKALRIGAPSDYAKQPRAQGEEKGFRQRVDPNATLNVGEGQSKIEWQDYKPT